MGRCVSRAAPEHGRGPVRVREERAGIRSARVFDERSEEFARAPRPAAANSEAGRRSAAGGRETYRTARGPLSKRRDGEAGSPRFSGSSIPGFPIPISPRCRRRAGSAAVGADAVERESEGPDGSAVGENSPFRDAEVLPGHVLHPPAGAADEVVVRGDVGVVAGRTVLHAHSGHEPRAREGMEDVVDRGAGEDRPVGVDDRLDVLGRRVPVRRGEVGEHRHSRLRHPEPSCTQQSLQSLGIGPHEI